MSFRERGGVEYQNFNIKLNSSIEDKETGFPNYDNFSYYFYPDNEYFLSDI